MNALEQIQEAIDVSKKKNVSESPGEAKEKPLTASDYLNLLLEKTKKLSGIIGCLGRMEEHKDDDDFINLAWAMSDFTDAIEKSTDDLWDHLKNIGVI
jgi:hypothetical protein